MGYYHGSQARITVIDREICMTSDEDAAASYAEGAGWLHAIDLAGIRIADEDDIWDAAAAVLLPAGYHVDPRQDLAIRGYAWTFEAADSPRVRAELAARGFGGCEYADVNPGNAAEHGTVRVWDAAALTITAITQITED